jgi:hypothetical protein
MKKNARNPFDRGDRVALAIAGALAILYGYGEILRSRPIYTTWLGQDTAASMPILLGGGGARSSGPSVGPHSGPLEFQKQRQ